MDKWRRAGLRTRDRLLTWDCGGCTFAHEARVLEFAGAPGSPGVPGKAGPPGPKGNNGMKGHGPSRDPGVRPRRKERGAQTEGQGDGDMGTWGHREEREGQGRDTEADRGTAGLGSNF